MGERRGCEDPCNWHAWWYWLLLLLLLPALKCTSPITHHDHQGTICITAIASWSVSRAIWKIRTVDVHLSATYINSGVRVLNWRIQDLQYQKVRLQVFFLIAMDIIGILKIAPEKSNSLAIYLPSINSGENNNICWHSLRIKGKLIRVTFCCGHQNINAPDILYSIWKEICKQQMKQCGKADTY